VTGELKSLLAVLFGAPWNVHQRTYYVRAYATNNSGTAYEERVSFETSHEEEAYGDLFQWGRLVESLVEGAVIRIFRDPGLQGSLYPG